MGLSSFGCGSFCVKHQWVLWYLPIVFGQNLQSRLELQGAASYVSLCHNLSLLHTITTLIHPHRYSCPHYDTPHRRLCASPGTVNHAPRPVGALDPREMVTIVGNTVGHRRLLELATEHAGNGVAPAPATMTAGGCTLNSRTSLTAIPPGAPCVRSMGHTSPLCLRRSYACTNAHATTLYICRTACYSAAPSKTCIGYSVTWRRTTRSCNRTTPAFRRKTTNYGLVSRPWALLSLSAPFNHHRPSYK